MRTSKAAIAKRASVSDKVELLELISSVGNAVCQDFEAAASDYGLTHIQVQVITHIGQHAAPMRDIAERLGCDASNITGIVDRLEAGGYVRREVSPTDRRVKHVIATPAGRDALHSIRAKMQAHAAVDTLTADERKDLHTLLERLRVAMAMASTTG